MNIALDYAAAREVAYLAIRRAATFMGLGINAARDDRLTTLTVADEFNVNFGPANPSADQISSAKKEFELWIVANGFREVIEGFANYLDRLYENSLLVSFNGKPLPADLSKKIKACASAGLPGKQKRLREEFGVTSEHTNALKSLYEARNCLAHERGIVTTGYCNSGDCLEIRWSVLEIFVRKNDGTEQIVEMRRGASPIFGPGAICKRSVVRTRRFKCGEMVRFSAKELSEILIFAFLVADSFLFPALKFAKSHGLDVPDATVKEREGSEADDPSKRAPSAPDNNS